MPSVGTYSLGWFWTILTGEREYRSVVLSFLPMDEWWPVTLCSCSCNGHLPHPAIVYNLELWANLNPFSLLLFLSACFAVGTPIIILILYLIFVLIVYSFVVGLELLFRQKGEVLWELLQPIAFKILAHSGHGHMCCIYRCRNMHNPLAARFCSCSPLMRRTVICESTSK